jgi:general stress protein 26
MSVTHAEPDAATVRPLLDPLLDPLLAGAARAIRGIRYCWLLTAAPEGLVHGRPMGRLLHAPDEDEWTIRFVVDGRSGKVAEVERERSVALIFQDDANDGYATLSGRATVLRGEAEVLRLWKPAFEAYFPTAADRANAMFIAVKVERMALWIRGVTPEPFGVQPTELERHDGGAWRLVTGLRAAA